MSAMKHARRNALWCRHLPVLLFCCLCVLTSQGCAWVALYGTIVDAELHKTPAADRAISRMEKRQIPGPQDPIPVRIYTPRGAGPWPVLVYFHGGGWVGGSPATHDDICRFLCSRAGCVVISVKYRLAPKHKFPAAFDDAYAAILWAHDSAARVHGDPDRIAVAGDSAGGNLAAAVALAARDRRGLKLVMQVLAFPPTDLSSLNTESFRQYGDKGDLTKEKVAWCRDQYLRGPEDQTNPFASPLLAPDHHGLPPALVIVGECDVLRDDGLAYAAKLAASGVPASTVRLAGQGHAAVYWAVAAENVRQALDAAAQALREAFSMQDTSRKNSGHQHLRGESGTSMNK